VIKNYQLNDENIMLRPYRLTDTEELYKAIKESTPELIKWMPWCHEDYSIDESRAWVESRDEAWETSVEYDFVVIDTGDRTLLGGCGLNHINYADRVANLGYWIRSNRTRQDIATRATLLLARFGFQELELNRIEIMAACGNKASQRVAEKAGATREGTLRNRIVIHDTLQDAVLFSLIPQDLTA